MPISGVMMSLTNAVMTAPNAAPITTAIARSTTFPRRTNALNSLIIEPSSGHVRGELLRSGRLAAGAPVGGAGVVALAARFDGGAAAPAGAAGSVVDEAFARGH